MAIGKVVILKIDNNIGDGKMGNSDQKGTMCSSKKNGTMHNSKKNGTNVQLKKNERNGFTARSASPCQLLQRHVMFPGHGSPQVLRALDVDPVSVVPSVQIFRQLELARRTVSRVPTGLAKCVVPAR